MRLPRIQKSFLNKLNKILAQRNLKLVVSRKDVHYELIDENLAPEEMQSAFRQAQMSWPSLETMFFKNDKFFTVFESLNEVSEVIINDCKSKNLDYYSDWVFHDLGLRCLENCASLEEMLIRLEVMFPDV